LVNSLLQFIKENELLDIGFEDEIFEASLALGKTRDIAAPFVLSELEVITDETEFQTIMASKVSNLVLSTLDPNADDPYIEFDAFLLNRIFEYMLRDQLSGHGVIHETVLFENYLMKALVPYVTMGEFFVVNIPISIEKVAEPTHRFQTIIKIEATPSLENNDLKIVLNDLDAGDVTLAGEHIENILVLLGDSDFIQEGAFVIEDFDSQISQPGMSIKSVDMVNSKLRVSVGLDDSLNLGDLADAIETVLDIISNNSYSPEVDDAISNLLDSLTDVEIDTTEAIEALIEVLDEMTPEEQQAFFDDLLEELGDTDFPFGDLFESLP
ncbi:MAG: hypothetical protein IH571_03340, partial [Acholeplasmataceae bacterium]|nr:hypothetical protein [Acholeplasmataceae bacterium]